MGRKVEAMKRAGKLLTVLATVGISISLPLTIAQPNRKYFG
jgi:hypothetical protein